jgi:hypothetical protein
MAIWSILEKKYLPSLPKPDWAIAADEREYWSRTHVPHFNASKPNPMKEIWDLVHDARLAQNEKIALSSTFDNVLAKVESIGKVLAAFRSFDGECSLKEQADLIEKEIKEDPELVAIGWNQTSVNGDTWESENLDKETEEYSGYNIETGDRHWFLIEELEEEARPAPKSAPEKAEEA